MGRLPRGKYVQYPVLYGDPRGLTYSAYSDGEYPGSDGEYPGSPSCWDDYVMITLGR